jgi:CobQ-like glutamine amidotransferase family enzyme
MVELVKQKHYVMRSPNRPNGPILFVNDKKLAELLLSKASVKFKQDIKLEIFQRTGTDHIRTSN